MPTISAPKCLITVCHGANGQGGINETTALRGMPKAYFIGTMEQCRDGHRHNDTAHGMSQFAQPLTEQEIGILTNYYACDANTGAADKDAAALAHSKSPKLLHPTPSSRGFLR
ncbi:MAG: c-type cytochrome [Halothiobacillus sp.]